MKVVRPLPAFCTIEPEEIVCVVTLLAVVIVKELMGTIEPMSAANVIFPVPAV